MSSLAEWNRARKVRGRPKCQACRKPLAKRIFMWFEDMDRDEPEPKVGGESVHGTVREVLTTRGNAPHRRIRFWTGQWGYQGNGYFCSMGCGYHWAVVKIERELSRLED